MNDPALLESLRRHSLGLNNSLLFPAVHFTPLSHLSHALHQPLEGDIALTECLLRRQVGVQAVQGHDVGPAVPRGRGQPGVLLTLGPLVPRVW